MLAEAMAQRGGTGLQYLLIPPGCASLSAESTVCPVISTVIQMSTIRVFECDAYKCLRANITPCSVIMVTTNLRLDAASMAASVCVRMHGHQVAAFIHDCVLARALGVDPVDLKDNHYQKV